MHCDFMPILSPALRASNSGKLPSVIRTSRALSDLGGQVSFTVTGPIPEYWVAFEIVATNIIFANNDSVTSIGSYAFSYTGIRSITIPKSVTTISSSCFSFCEFLNTIKFAEASSLLSIDNNAFNQCTSLASITIPNSVTNIGSDAFAACSSLATIFCYVAQSAFTGTSALSGTANPLTILARSTDSSWTAGTGLSFQGNTNITVIKNL